MIKDDEEECGVEADDNDDVMMVVMMAMVTIVLIIVMTPIPMMTEMMMRLRMPLAIGRSRLALLLVWSAVASGGPTASDELWCCRSYHIHDRSSSLSTLDGVPPHASWFLGCR